MRYMISLETFTKSLVMGEISRLNFTYESKEYLIAREADEEGVPVFVFVSEDNEAVKFPKARELLESVRVGGSPLSEVWKFVVPICDDTLYDDDYIKTMYGDSLGTVMCSSSGTVSLHDRYLTQYLIPSAVIGALVLIALSFCTHFIGNLDWMIFGIVSAVLVAALIVAQILFYNNTKYYRQGNPCAHCYLLSRGTVVVTDRFEYAIPYEKIIRLDTEAGIQITTLKTVFSFIADNGAELIDSLKSIHEEVKSIKRVFRKKGKKS